MIVADLMRTAPEPGYRGLVAFAEVAGLQLEPFQRRVLRAVLGPEPEALILLPRGAGKTTLMALVVVHHLLTVPDARVYVAASSRDQARILHEAAERFARPLGDENLVFRHLEMRWCPDPREPTVFTRHFRVLPAEGPRLHGLTPSLMIWDEAQAVTREDVYPALASALHKTPGSKLVTVSNGRAGRREPAGPDPCPGTSAARGEAAHGADRGARAGSGDARMVGAGGRERRQRPHGKGREPGVLDHHRGPASAAQAAARSRLSAVRR